MTEPYGFGEAMGFDSLRSAVDSEISNNKKTDAKQTEDIEKESQINEEQAQQISDVQTAAEEAQAAAENAQGVAEEAQTAAENAQGTADEAKTAAENAQAAIDVLNGEGDGSVKKAVDDAINGILDGAPETFDTLKEIADYIETHGSEAADMMDAIQKNSDAIAQNVDAISQNAEAIAQNADAISQNAEAIASNVQGIQANAQNIESLGAELADEVTAREEADAALKAELEGEFADADAALKSEMEEKFALADSVYTKQEVDEIVAPLAVKSEVTEEINAAATILQDAVDSLEENKVGWTESTPDRKHIVLKNHDSILGTATDGATYNVAMVSKWDVADFGSSSLHLNLNSKDGDVTINDDKKVATVDDVKAVEDKVDAIDLEPYATKEEVSALDEKKVDWTESTPGRKHIVLKNHDSVLGTALDGSTYNLAMVSKWDVADFGSSSLHLNLNSKDGVATINDDKQIAITDDIAAAKTELEGKIAEAVLPFFDGAEYVSADKKIVFKHGDEVKAEIDASDFIKDGMVDSVVVEGGKLVISFNTESGKEAIEINISDIFDANNYYNKSDVDAMIAPLAVKSTVDSQIDTEVAALNDAIAQKVDKVDYDAKVAEIEASVATKTAKEMNGANGKALIFNEADGGGAKFEHSDGTWSFAGVNDGGENGIAGQIYAVKKNASNKMEGTRIDVTKGAMYYTVGDAPVSERLVEANEIAVKGDVAAAVSSKADASALDAAVETFNQGISAKADKAELTAAVSTIEAEVASKANSADVYSKSEVDAKFDGVLNDIAESAVVDGDDIVLGGGEF